MIYHLLMLVESQPKIDRNETQTTFMWIRKIEKTTKFGFAWNALLKNIIIYYLLNQMKWWNFSPYFTDNVRSDKHTHTIMYVKSPIYSYCARQLVVSWQNYAKSWAQDERKRRHSITIFSITGCSADKSHSQNLSIQYYHLSMQWMNIAQPSIELLKMNCSHLFPVEK